MNQMYNHLLQAVADLLTVNDLLCNQKAASIRACPEAFCLLLLLLQTSDRH